MFKKTIVIIMAVITLLCGCQGNVKNLESTNTETKAETKAETSAVDLADQQTDDFKESKDTAVAVLSEMDALSYEASASELLEAYKADYRRAAASIGLSKNHDDWVYAEEPVFIGDALMLMCRISPGSKMILYDGIAESEEWIYQEVKLALMAADQSLTEAVAEQYVDEVWEEAWEKRDTIPSLVAKYLPNGILYSFSIREHNLFALRIGYYIVK